MDRTLWIAVLAALIITSIPSAAGMLFPPEDASWTGILSRNTADVNGYLSMIEETRQGHLRMRNLFTAEPHPPFQIRPVWLLLGLTGRCLPSLSTVHLMEIGRILTSFCLLLFIATFAVKLFDSQRERLLAFLIITFGSGLGWAHLVTDPPDLRIVETSTFLTLVSPPLYSLSLSLVLSILLLVERIWNGERKILFGFLGGLCAMWLGFDRPFSLGPLGVAVTILVIMGFLFEKRFHFKTFVGLLLLAFGALAAITYQFFSIRDIPVYAEWNRQHVLPTPEWPRLISSLGLLLPLAVMGARAFFAKNRVFATLCMTFIVASLVFSHLSWGFQERFLEGLPILTAVFASFGLMRILSYFSRPQVRTLFATIVLVVLSLSHFTSLKIDLAVIASQSPPQYMPDKFLNPMRKLKEMSHPGEAILSTEASGNFLIAHAGRPVVIAQRIATARYFEKNKLVANFFSTPAHQPASRHLFDQTRAKWLFWGPEESYLSRGRFNPFQASYLEKKYDNGFVFLFKLK